MQLFLDAQEKCEDFLENKLKNYEKLRNFDYGPTNESSVSKLSPYISHRVLLEYKLLEEVKKKYQSQKINKFIEEIYWRIYWKGWMENRPKVWSNFITKRSYIYDVDAYNKAINGNSELSFFNSWVNELKTYNYLHNHTRMWFASTWIFNLCLPWQLGANFFFKHLFDGEKRYCFPFVCNPATHLQLKRLEAASPSKRYLKKKVAPSCQGKPKLNIQVLANHIRVWLCK